VAVVTSPNISDADSNSLSLSLSDLYIYLVDVGRTCPLSVKMSNPHMKRPRWQYVSDVRTRVMNHSSRCYRYYTDIQILLRAVSPLLGRPRIVIRFCVLPQSVLYFLTPWHWSPGRHSGTPPKVYHGIGRRL